MFPIWEARDGSSFFNIIIIVIIIIIIIIIIILFYFFSVNLIFCCLHPFLFFSLKSGMKTKNCPIIPRQVSHSNT